MVKGDCCDNTCSNIDVPSDFDLVYQDLLIKNYEQNKGFLNFRYSGIANKFALNSKSILSFTNSKTPLLNHTFGLTTNLFKDRKISAEISPCRGITLSSEFASLNFAGFPHSVIGGLNTDRDFSRFKAYLNFAHDGEGKFEHLARIKCSCCSDKCSLSDRIILKHHEFKAGLALKFNIALLSLTRYNAFFGWRTKNKEFTFEHISRKENGFEISKLIFGGVIHYPLIDYAACFAVLPHKLKIIGGFSKTINDNVLLQAKIDDEKILAFNSVIKVTNKLKVGLGSSVKLTSSGISETVGDNSFKVPLSFNITFDAQKYKMEKYMHYCQCLYKNN